MSDPWQTTVDLFVHHGAPGREPEPDGSWSVTVGSAPGPRAALFAHAPAPFRTVLQADCESEDGGVVALSFGVDVATTERAVMLWRETEGEGSDVTLTVYPNVDGLVDGVLSARDWFDEEEEGLEPEEGAE